MTETILRLLLDDDYGIPTAAYWAIVESIYDETENNPPEWLADLHNEVEITERAFIKGKEK